jgi:hypothetical protein
MEYGFALSNNFMKNKPAVLAAIALAFVGSSIAQDKIAVDVAKPAPTPATMTLNVKDIPVAVIEGIRQTIVKSGVFAFPAGIENRPIKSLTLTVSGSGSIGSGVIVLAPAPVK